MVRLQPWQWVILATPIAAIIIFLLVAAGLQINAWGINWIWAVFTVVFVAWRWLLVRWTQPQIAQVEAALAGFKEELEAAVDTTTTTAGSEATQQAEAALQKILEASINDRPIWEDWQTFWQRCQDVVVAVANIYHPQVQYPLLNIYVPQAYGLIRGTVDDLDQWMQRLSPALNQATVGQAYQAYEVYRKLEPSARKLLRAWGWAQWLLNPVAAVANRATKGYSNRANQQLLVNLGQLLREAALRNLCRQAISLYGGITLPTTAVSSPPTIPQTKTQTLREILTQAEPVAEVEQKPISILLVGRTGAGKSSLINTLFQADLAAVDVLPSTDEIQNYHWETPSGETLTLWDTPGYEQVKRGELRQLVLDYATNADLLLLVTPALDPALQMDVDFLADMKAEIADLPAIAVVTQVDKLRPLREWEPPYNWEWGDRPKEISIREATRYRAEKLGDFSQLVVPVVTSDRKTNRTAWNIDTLSLGLIEAIAPAKQLRLARFLRDLDSRIVAAAKIIDHYTFQMATTQGLTALLKSPVLQFIATMSTGSPTLAYLLAQQIPVEQLPIVIGKLQIAYELFSLLKTDNANKINFDLISLWPLLLENSATPDRNAWAFGHALVEYWTQNLAVEKLRERFAYYLQQV
ncbi:MAG: GTPase family protein [Nostoc sp. TH1S01]|nr:GTPase family protein [Nostoc sp. TH1S01]